jgi:alpha-galactosidase
MSKTAGRIDLLPLAALASLLSVATAPGAAEIQVADLDLTRMTCGWELPRTNAAISGTPLSIRGQRFDRGVGTHAPSHLRVLLDGRAARLRAVCGVDDDSAHTAASVQFSVRADGRLAWQSVVLRGTSAAERVDVPLAGVTNLLLSVTDAGDGVTSDHADWAETVIEYSGARPVAAPLFPDPAEAPGGPPNAPAQVTHDPATGNLTLRYDDGVILAGRVDKGSRVSMTSVTGTVEEQRIRIEGSGLKAEVRAGSEALAAETRGPAQERFPLIRTAHGPSANLRNNAVYDRGRDWMIEGPQGATAIQPFIETNGSTRFAWTSRGPSIEIVFRPRYYQKHKNIPYYQPWTYSVRKDSITGWSSWWAYMRNFGEPQLHALLQVWKEKRFADYGYRFIQIDDCFQGGTDGGRPMHPSCNGYPGGRPETWLDWRRDLFPSGMTGYVARCRGAGFEPGVWIGSGFADLQVAEQHPDWFVQGPDGKPSTGPWVGFALDSSVPEARRAIAQPTYRGLHQAGFSYVKIDTLRHRLYDNLHRNLEYCISRGVRPDEIFRDYLRTARTELGPETFMLSCWGVLPESVGLADACRIGGDGYGPVTMQQYNSWNGIVWRNDPDHCDVYPRFKPAEVGNVQKTDEVKAANNDTVIRPALASLAGCLLMLSDKPEVYRDDRNLVGARRASPVLFSVPGQLYDYDPSKTDRLRAMERTAIQSGANASPIDADQFGAVCPWWLNEIALPFERWNVLHRLNWSDKPAPAARVSFADLGIDPATEYLVYEFWSGRFLGICREGFESLAQDPMGLQSYAIRARLAHPQLVSTSRHLSQGGVDMQDVAWNELARTLSGRSRVVAGDSYELVLHSADLGGAVTATCSGKPVEAKRDGSLMRVAWTPDATGTQDWVIQFSHSPQEVRE